MVVRFYDCVEPLNVIESAKLREIEKVIDSQLRKELKAKVEYDHLSKEFIQQIVIRYRRQGFEVKVAQENSSVLIEVFVFRAV